MAYTFGGATGDDINATASVSMGGSSRPSWCSCWFYPTTLTATRGILSAGNIWGLEIDTATDNLRIRADGTVDGQYTTAGAGIVTNKWHWVGYLSNHNSTGVVPAHRIWIATADMAPVELTITQVTAATGSFTGGTALTIGNKGTGALAFQGDIAQAFFAATNVNDALLNWPFISNSGTISADDAEMVRRNWVNRIWLGRLGEAMQWAMPNRSAGSQQEFHYFPLRNNADRYRMARSIAPAATGECDVIAATVNGAVLTGNNPPYLMNEAELFGHGLAVATLAGV